MSAEAKICVVSLFNSTEIAASSRIELSARQLGITSQQLEVQGTHPDLGPVTTWTALDLSHLVQITRAMAKTYRHEVGPWAEYLSVMK